MPSKATAAYNYVVQFRRKSYQVISSGAEHFNKDSDITNNISLKMVPQRDFCLILFVLIGLPTDP